MSCLGTEPAAISLAVVKTFWDLELVEEAPRRTRCCSDGAIDYRCSESELGAKAQDAEWEEETASVCSTDGSASSSLGLESLWSEMEAEIEETSDLIVLSLKKCNAGPPLLPNAGSWEFVSKEGFSLPGYLRLLAQRLDLDVTVHACLEGRSLVPYQAAIDRLTWESICSEVQGTLTKQRAAYRRLNGGGGAPVLVEAPEPRFLK
jgi:hypothetical protein